MSEPVRRVAHASLVEAEYRRCVQIAKKHLKKNDSIRNLVLRRKAGISYDQAIYVFNRAIKERGLIRCGAGSATRYALPKARKA